MLKKFIVKLLAATLLTSSEGVGAITIRSDTFNEQDLVRALVHSEVNSG